MAQSDHLAMGKAPPSAIAKLPKAATVGAKFQEVA
jgi:hypothetical protein